MILLKITINKDNLTLDDNFQALYKVRAIIENSNGEILICNEGNKIIFPGGKKNRGETNEEAIKREIKEESGIDLDISDFREILEIETFYKNYFDYRTGTKRPRYMSTVYFYAKCYDEINSEKMDLTSNEIKENFIISFVSKEKLFELLSEDHSQAKNGEFFDEENQVILNYYFKKKLYSKNLKVII